MHNLAVLAFSLLAFVAFEGRDASLQTAVLLTVVVGIHELGHFIGMRFFGYRDVHVFFIPLFGAATAGMPTAVSGVRRAVVALLGPLPGILLGIACAALYTQRAAPFWMQAARAFLFINTFNFLPFYPLDGARLLDYVLLWRAPAAEVIIKGGGIAALAYFAVVAANESTGDGDQTIAVLWFIFLLRMLQLLPATYRKARIALTLRRNDRYTGHGEQIPRDFIETVTGKLGSSPASADAAGAAVRDIWQRVTCTLPGPVASAALMSVAVLGVGGGAMGLKMTMMSPAVVHNNLGLALSKQGRLEEAVKEYRQAIRLRPAVPQPHLNLAGVFERQRRFDEAVGEYREAISLDPHLPEAHTRLGRCLERLGDDDQAIEQFGEAVRLQPQVAIVHVNLGRVLERQGKREDAIREYQDALRLDARASEAEARLRALSTRDARDAEVR